VQVAGVLIGDLVGCHSNSENTLRVCLAETSQLDLSKGPPFWRPEPVYELPDAPLESSVGPTRFR
jgi:hypothetical protein